MVPKKHRLKDKRDFDFVYKQGKKAFTPYFVVISAHQTKERIGNEAVLPRFGFVASSKVGKAVERNKAKRMMREIVRKELPFLKRDFDAVVVTFHGITEATHEALEKASKEAFQELKLYNIYQEK